MAGIAEIAKVSGVKWAGDVQRIAEAIKTISATENVIIRGFGTFKTKVRAARKYRNPHTGAEIDIPAKSVVTFKAAKPAK